MIADPFGTVRLVISSIMPSNFLIDVPDVKKVRHWRRLRLSLCARHLRLFLILLIICGNLAACIPLASPSPGQLSSPPSVTSSIDSDPYVKARLKMVEETIQSRGVIDPNVLRVMRTLPRHMFVPPDLANRAYEDHPLPIGYGQTISQPYIVAWMTELLQLSPGEKVLEIGTGSGYQAAVLAELGGLEVYSIEIVPELAQSAESRLKELGYRDVKLKQSDGYYGWQEYAPFDAIIVTAAPDHLPAPLVAQLKEGGRLVIPIGPPGGYQDLWKFINEKGVITAYNMGGVSFVPLTREGVK
jgi:protein-L-isoaspartate(D-aspartate) O-methyltransferase